MYEQVFNLNSRPFTSTPYVKHYYPANAISGARDLCRLIIDRGAGPVVIVGDHGTGKTLLLALLEEQYASEYKVVNLSCSMLQSKADLLQCVLFATQQDYRGMKESEMRLGLIEYVKTNESCGSGVLLLLDDAQKLSRETIEELQLLTNFIRDGQPRVRLVLAGSRGLEDRLADPGLESFNQRISGRFFLACLDRSEVEAYVRAHVENAGGSADRIFVPQAYRAISDVSEGRPRLINQVCDHAMIYAATRGVQTITDSLIREAWMDVQKLPCGVKSAVPEAVSSSSTPLVSVDESDGWTVLEFGELDSESETGESLAEPNAGESQSATGSSNNLAEELTSDLLPTDSIPAESFVTETESAYPDLATAGSPPASAAEANFGIDTGVGAGAGVESSETTTVHFDEDSNLTNAPVEEALMEYATAMKADAAGQDLSQSTLGGVSEYPQIEPASEASPVGKQVVNDPFANDEFDDEEILTDTYSPFVAEQNQRSLSVTTDHLRDLTPGDMTASESQQDEPCEFTDEEESETVAVLTVDSEESFPTFETALQPPTPAREPLQREFELREDLETRSETEVPGPNSTSEEFVVGSDLPEMAKVVQSKDGFEGLRVELEPIAAEQVFNENDPDIVPLDPNAPSLAEAYVSEASPQGYRTDIPSEAEQAAESEETVGRQAELSTFLPPDAIPVKSAPIEESKAEEKFHIQAEVPNDPEISRMAADIIRSLNTESDSAAEPVSHETTLNEIEQETAAIESTIQQSIEQQGHPGVGVGSSPAVVLPGTNRHASDQLQLPGNVRMQQPLSSVPLASQPAVDDYPPALSLSAREEVTSQESAILSEIQSQASMLDQAASTPSQTSQPFDDRDILNVSQNIEDAAKPPAAPGGESELPSWSQTEPSRGEANRVDYQQLFNQLRNINPED